MFKLTAKAILLVLVLLVPVQKSLAQKVNEPQAPSEWAKPYEPFRIAGNLYYVGTYDLACYLVATPKGHILINTGLASSAKIIKANVEALGFKFNEIKILLTTQAHYDHLGAMAAIAKQTGAKFMVYAKDAQVAADGGISDYAFGKAGRSFQPIKAQRLLKDVDTIKLGSMNVVMLHHPGHTKGSCSYLMDVKDQQHTYRVLIANMPSIVVEGKFADVTTYPNIAKDYAYTFNAMKKLKFDLWLSSHASQFQLHSKHKPGDAYNPESFADQKGYDTALNDFEKDYKKKLAQ